jgi:hypothetical protein
MELRVGAVEGREFLFKEVHGLLPEAVVVLIMPRIMGAWLEPHQRLVLQVNTVVGQEEAMEVMGVGLFFQAVISLMEVKG